MAPANCRHPSEPPSFQSDLVLLAPDERLETELVGEERAQAEALSGRRRLGFIAGRAALRQALRRLGHLDFAVLRGPGGEPILPPRVAASISHKDSIAAAWAEPAEDGHTLGLDLELCEPLRVDIARRVMTSSELAAQDLATQDLVSAEARQARVRLVFCAKEAIYKAIYPFVRRYVGFHEVELLWVGARVTAIRLNLDPAGPSWLDGAALSLEHVELTTPLGALGPSRVVVAACRARPPKNC